MFGKTKLIFLGGMSNIITETGETIRNDHRDGITARVKKAGYRVFDPQIWGRKYDKATDGPNEGNARKDAFVMVYELGSQTDCHITMDEIRTDALLGRRVIVYITGKVNEEGYPVFDPAGFKPDTIGDKVTRLHAVNAINRATSRRADVIGWIRQEHKLGNLRRVRIAMTEDSVINELRDFGIRI